MDAAVAKALSMDALLLRCQSARCDFVAALVERPTFRDGVRSRCVGYIKRKPVRSAATHALRSAKPVKRTPALKRKP